MNAKQLLCVASIFACVLFVVPLVGDDSTARRIEFVKPEPIQDQGQVEIRNTIVDKPQVRVPDTIQPSVRNPTVTSPLVRLPRAQVMIKATIAEIDDYALLGLSEKSTPNEVSGEASPKNRLGKLEMTPEVRIIDTETLGIVTTSLKEHARSGKAAILSQPTVVTLDGRVANIEVGQLVESDDGVPEKPTNIGIKMSCTPQVTKENRIILAIDLSQSKISDNKDLAVGDVKGITNQRILTALDVGPDQSALLTLPRENGLLVLLSPTIVHPAPPMANRIPRAIDTPGPIPPKVNDGSVVQATRQYPSKRETSQRKLTQRIVEVDFDKPKSNTSKMATYLKLFDEAFKEIGIGSLSSISAFRDEITVSAKLSRAQQSMIPDLMEGIASSGVLEVERAELQADDSDLVLELVCRPKKTDVASSQSESIPSELDALLNKLFPDAKFQLHEANKTAVIIQGDVDVETANLIVSVAEQYYPTVVNLTGKTAFQEIEAAIKSAQPAVVNVAEASRSKAASELRLLHQDVKSLHRDVKTLIKLLENENE